MRKKCFVRSAIIAAFAVLFLFSNTAWAYWVWTPGTKKFINPKYAVKDTPKEQFEWGMSFYNAKDYQRAATEFDKLTKQYEYSEYASKAQYYVGLCYENMNKFYIAFQNYQKAIDNFPHIENMDEIVAREFNIANLFAAKESPKVLGADILTSMDRAIEIYKKVVDNAPYGRLAEEAQFKMGEAMKKAERYDEAIQAFQKILDDYPTSTFVDKAKFEVADCANKASLKPAYDAEPTERAIKAFEDFSRENRDRVLSKEADKTIQRLRDKAAQKSLLTAQFYEKIGRYQAAIIYYKDVIETYPDSSFVNQARSKVDALTARLEKPKSAFFTKPLSFTKPAKPKEAVGAEAVSTEAPAVAEVPKAKGWKPLSFTKPAKPKETAVKTAAETKAPRSKGWWPFVSKPSKPKEAVPEVAAETKEVTGAGKSMEAGKVTEKKKWSMFGFRAPLDFSTPSKPKEKEAVEAKETPKKKAWAPFNFSKPSAPKAEEAVRVKGWTPLNFTKTKAPAAEKTITQAKAETKIEEPKKEEVAVPESAQEKPAATATEEPSEIKVTTNEAEVKTAEERAAEQPVKSEAASLETEKQENTEDQIDKSEY